MKKQRLTRKTQVYPGYILADKYGNGYLLGTKNDFQFAGLIHLDSGICFPKHTRVQFSYYDGKPWDKLEKCIIKDESSEHPLDRYTNLTGGAYKLIYYFGNIQDFSKFQAECDKKT